MKTIQRKYAILTILLSFAIPLHAQTVNTDAVTKYWELTRLLKQNIPLTDKQWDDFIAIDGNKTYAESEFTTERLANYRKAIEIVYMPKNDSLLQVRLKQKNWYCILAKRYKDEELQLKAYLADTVLNPAYFNNAYQYVYEYLPKKAQHHIDGLKLYYNCLSNDAVSYPQGLFFSLLSVIDNAKAKTGTLEAHELHHRLRPNLDFDSTRVSNAHAEGLLWAINTIPNEGIADMIDKPAELQQTDDPHGIADWLLDAAPATLKSLDSCIQLMAVNKTTGLEKVRFYRNMLKGTVGHMPGFYMARVIVKNGYKKQMVNRSYDPFEFFYLYYEAAKKDEDHPYQFSAASISYLKALRRMIYR
ncbi:DUF5700 domain-containing putative Zn-dependent protease [Mucilaginibacter polytrichastri]|uniref:Uncharacterized protein n=1 Tax=Mucilaginibacter polytrichastri TaxID=1302689 RepID=A0A1Q5ZYQ0_9SPHI|nr:DUF5700 domain-containing putative Zn-dependent protease [Mucilaginibacter polytrichastri]OKS86868.1 hypothetical protein RG47T_2326 [Mucilaginibacter polytrichastri]